MRRRERRRDLTSPAMQWGLAFALTGLLFLYEVAVFPVGAIDFVRFYVERAVYGQKYFLFLFAMGTVALGFALTAAAVVVAGNAHGVRRAVYAAALMAVIVLEHGYLRALGRHLTGTDLAIARSLDPAGLLDGAITYLRPVESALPCLVLILAVWAWPRSDQARARQRMELVAGGVLVAGACATPWLLQYFPATSVTAFVRFAASETVAGLTRYDGPREPVDWEAGTPPDRNVVLIVDESVRPDHLSVNGYDRPTTPTLERLQRRGLVVSWGLATATATNSVDSNRALWSGYFDWPDTDEYRRRTSIAQLARAAGFETWVVDGWMNRFWVGRPGDLDEVDHHLTPASAFAESDFTAIDRAIAEWLVETLAKETGHFVWINKRGIHWPYHGQYPAVARQWIPDHESRRIEPDQVGPIINAYDNAIRHNVDGFFAVLEPHLPELLEHSTILYTSDHGQTLSQGGEPRTHGGGSAREAMVPILELSRSERALIPSERATHADLYLRLIDSLGIPTHVLTEAPEAMRAPLIESGTRYYFWHRGMRGGLGRYERVPFRLPGTDP